MPLVPVVVDEECKPPPVPAYGSHRTIEVTSSLERAVKLPSDLDATFGSVWRFLIVPGERISPNAIVKSSSMTNVLAGRSI